MLHYFESTHGEDLEAIIQILVKIANRPAQQIKPHLGNKGRSSGDRIFLAVAEKIC